MKTLKKFALFCVFCLGALVTVYQSWGVMLMAIPSVIWLHKPLVVIHTNKYIALLFWFVLFYINWLFATAAALTYFFVHVWDLHQKNIPLNYSYCTKRTPRLINPSTGLLMKNRHFDIAGNAYGWSDD
ncbi:TPA: hypothetical protein RI760_002722 [Vibrio cholerae]|uniref:hypothetical protein n=1 Tax=Vibrio cholerae TaxID=666 RepID=UPI000E0A74AD|nr:hypothetical protein [Vibrio cholerae]EJL6701830.1 hypothetical protein [Vibrio cholerae]ELJ8713649.1 hypothetical protein [Vibrio cholerae]HAS3612694.1 hypothetical protein [Vibrio cholerae]HDV5419539.1 hypothetical protein [Vibrio cholerae]HDV5616825.1 hypothetical protein [Vibrio cholerae]